MDYLRKIGPAHVDIRKDKRMRPGPGGVDVLREVQTWQEAHAILVELEAFNQDSQAVRWSQTGAAWPVLGGQKGDAAGAKGRGKSGKGMVKGKG